LKGVADTAGVVCVNFFAPFVHESDFTIDRLVDHITHIAGIAGIEHVGLGPDFIHEVWTELTPPWCEDFTLEGLDPLSAIRGLEGPTGLPLLTERLLARGYAPGDVRAVLGENVLRLFRAELGQGRPLGRSAT
jgi:membrane dipeptidase